MQEIIDKSHVVLPGTYPELGRQRYDRTVGRRLYLLEVGRVGIGWFDALVRVVEENCFIRLALDPVHLAAGVLVQSKNCASCVEASEIGTQVDALAQSV